MKPILTHGICGLRTVIICGILSTLLSCRSRTLNGNGASVVMQMTSYVANDYYMNWIEFRKLRFSSRVWPSKKVSKESYDLTWESGARDIYLPFQVLSKYRTFPLYELVSARCNRNHFKYRGWSMALLNKLFPSRKKAIKQGYVRFGKNDTER